MSTETKSLAAKITPGRAIATGHGAYVNGRAATSIECEQVDGIRPTVAYVMDEFDGGEMVANVAQERYINRYVLTWSKEAGIAAVTG